MVMMIKVFKALLLFTFFTFCSQANVSKNDEKDDEAIRHFLNLFEKDRDLHVASFKFISENWKEEYTPIALEVIYLQQDTKIIVPLLQLLEEHTKQNFVYDFNEWYEWLWNQDEKILAKYADFKAELYKRIDPKFEQYFKGRYMSDIRLDEIRWGGVFQDGIPPLRDPEMITANEQDYLDDDNIVFGISVNGDVRAYPKRILAWHEMFVDEVGGIPVAGVYCTLCGTVVLYKTTHKGKNYEMGTSGFLYRSNKLMYDKATQSLWNTLWGTPVLGPLKDKGIEFEHLSVVTTTWGEWKERHPETKVLSLATNHRRNYGEGVAYQEYFATDQLMFNTPFNDGRLKNKQEVLALRFKEAPDEQLAISTRFLDKHEVYQNQLGKVSFVVLTDQSGGNRVYETNGQEFKKYDGKYTIEDKNGNQWKLSEDEIVSADGTSLKRLPYHRSFWFGWLAAFPDTKLIK